MQGFGPSDTISLRPRALHSFISSPRTVVTVQKINSWWFISGLISLSATSKRNKLSISFSTSSLYWAKVAGVNWHDRHVSYEFLRKATAGSYEFCIGPEAIRSSREAR
jgi:hypothetical protein